MNTRIQKLMAAVMLTMVISLAGCGGSGGNTPTNATPENGGGAGSGNTITGQVAVGLSDLPAAKLRADQLAAAKASPVLFKTSAKSVLPGAAVTLYKMNADGTEELVSGLTATTDASGNYTLACVPDAVTGTGAATDYYYEVRATSGSVEVTAPVAPTGDETVNVSPETKIAAAMISDVASLPTATNAMVLPTGKSIELLRDGVYDNIAQMPTFSMPSTTIGAEARVDIAAEAVSSNSGNADKLMQAYEGLLEGVYILENKDTAPEERIAAYLERVMKASCNYEQAVTLPQAASAALAAALKSGVTFTLGQIANAYNHNGGTPPVDVNGIIIAYNGVVNSLNTALTNSASIPDAALIGIYTSKGDLGAMTADSSLQVDQALVLFQALPSNQQKCQAPLNYLGIVSELLHDTTLAATASFADVQVYHQRLQCPQGNLEARVKVYSPQGINDVSGVTIFAAGLKDQSNVDILSALTFTHDDFPSAGTSNWKLTGGNQQVCVAFGQTYTFTIAANLISSGTLTTSVTRTVLDVPEAGITLMARDYSETAVVFTQSSTGQPNSPIKLSTALSGERPLFKWAPAPGADAATAIGAPAGSQLKYLYDVSHFAINPMGGGGPENRDFTNCPVVQNPNGKFFDKDYVLSPIDCDVDKCNTALSDMQHVCRIHVQTVLVDEFDRTLGWSAGADLYYCIEGQVNCP